MVLGHPQHADTIVVRHPVVRLDQPARGHVCLELGQLLRLFLDRPVDFQVGRGGAAAHVISPRVPPLL